MLPLDPIKRTNNAMPKEKQAQSKAKASNLSMHEWVRNVSDTQ
jgi:hypothetical protein